MSQLPPTVRRNIACLWLAQIISSAGDAVYHIGLMWLILDLTGSSTATGLIAMSAAIPAMLFGLYAGVLADRYNRMGLMIFANLSQAFTVILIPILLIMRYEYAIVFGLLAFIRAAFGTLFPPATNALVPELVDERYLVRVNSILTTSQQLAWLIGPAMAGGILHFTSVKTLFFMDAFSFILAIGMLLGVKKPAVSNRVSKLETSWRELVSGIRFVADHSFMGFLIVLTIANNLFIMGPALVGMPILVKIVLAGSAADYAFVESFMAAGMLLGSVFIYRYGSRFSSGHLLLTGMILDGLTYSVFYWINSVAVAWSFIFLHGIGIPLITVSRTALIQRYTPNRYHGRIFSMVHLAVVGVTALSAAMIGILADRFNIQIIFFWIGIGAAACGIIGWLHPKIRHQS